MLAVGVSAPCSVSCDHSLPPRDHTGDHRRPGGLSLAIADDSSMVSSPAIVNCVKLDNKDKMKQVQTKDTL